MGYNDPSPQQRNALAEINQARQRALKCVSKIREINPSTDAENLCRAGSNPETSAVPIRVNQAVVDYLLQLRPYRNRSEKWDIDFGTISLPKRISRGKSKRLGHNSEKPALWCAQVPKVNIGSLSDLVNALNTTIVYTTDSPASKAEFARSKSGDTIRLGGDEYQVPRSAFSAFLAGDLAPDDIRAIGTPTAEIRTGERYQPPRLTHDAEEVRSYKFILPPNQLLKLVEVADEVAADMDLLIELEDPDFSAGGGAAV